MSSNENLRKVFFVNIKGSNWPARVREQFFLVAEKIAWCLANSVLAKRTYICSKMPFEDHFFFFEMFPLSNQFQLSCRCFSQASFVARLQIVPRNSKAYDKATPLNNKPLGAEAALVQVFGTGWQYVVDFFLLSFPRAFVFRL